MKPQEAIKYFKDEIIRLKNAPAINGCKMTEEWEEQIKIGEVAISALEKQIPKKLIINEKDGMRHCPNCDTFYLSGGKRHCEKCGQALDWSEEE